VFGKVVDGKEVVDKIKRETGLRASMTTPLEDVLIEKAVVRAESAHRGVRRDVAPGLAHSRSHLRPPSGPDAATFAAWRLSRNHASRRDLHPRRSVRVWIGDDEAALPGFEAKCARSSHGDCAPSIYFMHGNRDFLVGDDSRPSAG
jgi:hypothetical protein